MYSINEIKDSYSSLLLKAVSTLAEYEAWLYEWSEFEFSLDEIHARLYVQSFCDTKDTKKESAYLNYIKEVEPLRKELASSLQKRFLESPFHALLPKARYAVLTRIFESQQRIYRAENIPLQVAEQERSHDYQKICGSLTVSHNGETLPLPKAAALFSSETRPTRETLWRKTWDARLAVSAKVDQIFSESIELRSKIAQQAACKDFVEYTFFNLKRFDYSRNESRKFHDSIEKFIVPLARQIYKSQKDQLRVSELRPWDIGSGRLFDIVVDPTQEKSPERENIPLQKTGKALLALICPELVNLYEQMLERGEMDLDTRTGKGPGAFCWFYPKSKRPVIVMNAAESAQDLFVLLHEFGHAVHAMQSKDQPIHAYQNPGMEIAEVASMSMELFAYPYLDQVLGKNLSLELKRGNLKRMILFFPYLAQIDAFQLWVYENPVHSADERQAKWVELDQRFGGPFNWEGLEQYRRIFWQQQHHLFSSPFYYIEYGIAQLGALQLMSKHKTQPKETVAQYLNGLSLGASRPLPELFEAVGAKFDFSEDSVRPISEMLSKMLGSVSTAP